MTGKSSKSDLKKIGEILGADVFLYFGLWINQDVDEKKKFNYHITFRLVDCQTSKVLIAGNIKTTCLPFDNELGWKTTRMIGDAIVLAGKCTAPTEIFGDVNRVKPTEGSKELFQKRNGVYFVYMLDNISVPFQ